METSHKPFKVDKELILFAAEVSKHFKFMTIGPYFSKKQNYKIRIDTNKNFGSPKEMFFRVNILTQFGEFSNEYNMEPEISSDFIFYCIIWCACLVHLKNEFNYSNFEGCDRITMKYYLTTGRNFDTVVKGYEFLFKNSSNAALKYQRISILIQVKEDYDKTPPKREFTYTVDRDNKTVTIYPIHMLYTPYKSFMNGLLHPNEMKYSDFKGSILNKIRKRYLPKGFKIFFGFNKDLFEIPF